MQVESLEVEVLIERVREDMTNCAKDLHGACAMYLVDMYGRFNLFP